MSYGRFAAPHWRPTPITRSPIPQVSIGLHSRGGSESHNIDFHAVNGLRPDGFKFLVQWVNDGAGARRLPRVWHIETLHLGCAQMGDGVQLPLGVAREVCAIGQVLAQ